MKQTNNILVGSMKRKTRPVPIRLDDSIIAKLQGLARQEGLPFSTFLRSLIVTHKKTVKVFKSGLK